MSMEENDTDTLTIDGMMCMENCAKRVKNAALSVKGVVSAEVDFDNKQLHVSYGPEGSCREVVALAVESAGYDVEWTYPRQVRYVKVEGMHCRHCVDTVERAVGAVPGVQYVAVCLDQSMAAISVDDSCDMNSVVRAVEDVGFGATECEGNQNVTVALNTDQNSRTDISSPIMTVPGVACAKCDIHSGVLRVRGCASLKAVLQAAVKSGCNVNSDTFGISGMMCMENCAKRVKNAALSVKGVVSAEVDFDNKQLHVSYGPEGSCREVVALAVESAGYDVEWTYPRQVRYVKVEGMHCRHCVDTVERAVGAVPGVQYVAVCLDQSMAAISVDDSCDMNSVVSAVEDVGYDAQIHKRSQSITLAVDNITNIADGGKNTAGAMKSVPGVACIQLDPQSGILTVRGSASLESLLKAASLTGFIVRVLGKERNYESLTDEHHLPASSSQISEEERNSKHSNITDPVCGFTPAESLELSVLQVRGMTCGACVAAVERVIRKHNSVRRVSVALLTEKAEVEYDGGQVSAQQLVEDINGAGYEAEVISTLKGEAVGLTSRNFRFVPSSGLLLSSEYNQGTGDTMKAEELYRKEELLEMIQNIGSENSIKEVQWLQGNALSSALGTEGEDESLWTAILPRFTNAKSSTDHVGESVLNVTYDSTIIGLREVFDKLSHLYSDFDVSVLARQGKGSGMFLRQQRDLRRIERQFFFALGLTIPVAIIMWSGSLMVPIVPGLSVMSLVTIMLVTPVQFITGWRFYKEAYNGMLVGTYGMGLLIAIGTSFAYLFGLFSVLYSICLGGVVESYPDHIMTAAMLITFMLLGKAMEMRAKARTSSALKTLMDRQAKVALLLTDYDTSESGAAPVEKEISTDMIQRDDVVKVIRGAVFPADGEVIFGEGEANEALITGEAMPVQKAIGSDVIGGSQLVEGLVYVRVRDAPENSVLQQIISLVESAQTQKAKIQQLADTIAGVFTLFILLCAVVVFVVWIVLLYTDSVPHSILPERRGDLDIVFTLAISTLVVACPCALGLSTPTAIMVGTGVGAKLGILIKGGESLETADKITTVVFDKTGTITKGQPRVTAVHLFNRSAGAAVKVCLPEIVDENDAGDIVVSVEKCHSLGPLGDKSTDEVPTQNFEFMDFTQLVWLAACAETNSEHVLGRAVVQHARMHRDMPAFDECSNIEATTGRGIRCTVGSTRVMVGSLTFMQEAGATGSYIDEYVKYSEHLQNSGAIAIFVAVDDVLCGLFQITDPPRPEAVNTVAALRAQGVAVWMVTGDNARTAKALGAEVGIPTENIIAGALPNTKMDHVKCLQQDGEVVGFSGDGINDAAAIAQADVGIAIGGGTDVAMDSADMVLMRADLFSVVVAIDLSRAIIRCIKRNLFWALAYNTVAIPIAGGLSLIIFRTIIPPWIAGAAMSLSSVSVVLSSLALLDYTPPSHAMDNAYTRGTLRSRA